MNQSLFLQGVNFDTFLAILLISLSSWRLASILSKEQIGYHVRSILGVVHDVYDHPIGYTNPIASVFLCIWCMSIWTSIISFLLFIFIPPLVYILSSSALAILVEEWIFRPSNSADREGG